ncbi:MAG: right-handed parallel beta-helix repeat-containing protein, partial [Elusimicrobiota bacterium]
MRDKDFFIMVVVGDHMGFLLEPGDRILVETAAASDLRAGDAYVTLRWSQSDRPQPAVRRCLGRFSVLGRRVVLSKGDLCFLPEPAALDPNICGRVAAVWHEGGWRVLARSRFGWRGWLAAGLSPLLNGALAGAGRGGPGRRRLQDLARRFLLAAASEIRPDAGTPDASSHVRVLSEDAVWSGVVAIAGDVVVPPGVTLRIASGTRVSFREMSGRCSLVVEGRLLAEGRPDQRIRFFGDGPWGGIHFIGKSRGSELARVDIENGACGGINLWDRAAVKMSDMEFRDNFFGISLQGRAQADVDGAAVRASSGHGVRVRGGALKLRRAVIAGNHGVGIAIESGAGSARLEDVTVQENRGHGISVRGGFLRARGCRFERNADAGMLVEAGGHVAAQDCALNGNRFGLTVRAGTSRLLRVAVADSSDIGIDYGAGEHSLRDVRISGGGAALVSSGRDVSAVGLEVEDCHSGVCLRSGRLDWRGGGVRGSSGDGARVEGGRLRARGCRFEGNAGAGIMVEADGRVEAQDCAVAGNRSGLAVRGGAAALIRVAVTDCAETGLVFEAGEHSLRDVRISGGGAALVSSGRSVSAVGLEITDCRSGVCLRSGRLDWQGGEARGGCLGLEVLTGGQADLDGVVL